MNKAIMRALSISGATILTGLVLLLIFSPQTFNTLFAESNKNIGAETPPVIANSSIKAINDAMVSVSDAVIPTVVSISVVMESKASDNKMREEFREFFKFFGEPFNQDDDNQTRKSEASGSGVFISSDGYIVTNNHVIENATEIKVTTSDRKTHKAELIGSDPLTDLAVIKIDGSGYQAAHLAKIEDVKVGELSFAVGNPLGLNSTVTFGIVSQIGRGQLNILRGRDSRSVEYFIQTDAAINPGNSGGGLFDIEGSLIGINTAIATQTGGYMGYGFAIPVDLVRAVVVDLIDDGKINRGYIGVTIKTITESHAKYAGLENVEGVVVNDVIDDGAGKKAGLEPGDIILEVDGKKVATSNELQSIIVLHRAGDEVKLTIWRDKKKIIKTVKLMPKDDDEIADDSNEPKKGDEDNDSDSKKPVKFDNLGFSIAPLTKEQKKDLQVDNGVLISKVDRYSPASNNGLFPNGVIVKADRNEINSVNQLKKLIDSKKSGDVVLLQVKYKDNNVIIAIEIPENKK